MNKEDLKFGYIYRIEYTNPYCHNASYHGNAIFRNKDEDELYFDLIDRGQLPTPQEGGLESRN